jgi:hypothetical protein
LSPSGENSPQEKNGGPKTNQSSKFKVQLPQNLPWKRREVRLKYPFWQLCGCAYEENLCLKSKNQRTTLLLFQIWVSLEKATRYVRPFEQCPAPFLGLTVQPCGTVWLCRRVWLCAAWLNSP